MYDVWRDKRLRLGIKTFYRVFVSSETGTLYFYLQMRRMNDVSNTDELLGPQA